MAAPTMDAVEAAMVVDGLAENDSLEYRVEAMQYLIDTGLAWTLQGRVGREAMVLIEAGYCTLGPEPMRDAYGGRIPSKFEVEPGTKGSDEYVRAKAAQR
jgi:hypothetical protein